jgi:hypothetical protein
MDYETVKGERELWRGKQLAVTTFRILGLGRWRKFWISHDEINSTLYEDDGGHHWPEYIAGKGNVDIDEFIIAWLIALGYTSKKDIDAIIENARERSIRIEKGRAFERAIGIPAKY